MSYLDELRDFAVANNNKKAELLEYISKSQVCIEKSMHV